MTAAVVSVSGRVFFFRLAGSEEDAFLAAGLAGLAPRTTTGVCPGCTWVIMDARAGFSDGSETLVIGELISTHV